VLYSQPKGSQMVNRCLLFHGLSFARTLLCSVAPIPAIAMPKVEHADQLQWLSSIISFVAGKRENPVRVIAMIESGLGVIQLPHIVKAIPHRLVALIFGADDYAASIGAARSTTERPGAGQVAPLFRPNEEVSAVRQLVVMHAKSHGLQALDLVQINYHDEAALVRECQEGAALGYTGKQIIHPKQIGPAQQHFSPPQHRIQWAKKIVDAYNANIASGRGAFELDGQMIDLPTVKIAQTLLARAHLCGLV